MVDLGEIKKLFDKIHKDIKSLEEQANRKCKWTSSRAFNVITYHAECGYRAMIEVGKKTEIATLLADNNMYYCEKCGGKIEEV